MFAPIKYRAGYKYQLAQSANGQTPIHPKKAIDTEFIKLTADGHMWIKRGYAWDGPSGPTFDSKKAMTPSLYHDCFCQLIRTGYLPDSARVQADYFFYEMLRERKMWKLRAKIWLRGVLLGGKYHHQKPKKVHIAP